MFVCLCVCVCVGVCVLSVVLAFGVGMVACRFVFLVACLFVCWCVVRVRLLVVWLWVVRLCVGVCGLFVECCVFVCLRGVCC